MELGDVVNKGSRSTISISKSERTRLSDSCTDDRWDTCDPGGLSGVSQATIGEISEGTTEATLSSDLATLEFAESRTLPNRREGSMTQTPAANGTFELRPAAAGQEPVSGRGSGSDTGREMLTSEHKKRRRHQATLQTPRRLQPSWPEGHGPACSE